MYNKELEEYYKYVTENEQTELVLKLQNRLLRTKINDSQDLRDKLKVAEDKVRQISLELSPMKNETQRIYNEALQTTNGISPTDEAFAALDKIFNKLPPTIEELNNELNIAQAKVFCMENNVDGEYVSIINKTIDYKLILFIRGYLTLFNCRYYANTKILKKPLGT